MGVWIRRCEEGRWEVYSLWCVTRRGSKVKMGCRCFVDTASGKELTLVEYGPRDVFCWKEVGV